MVNRKHLDTAREILQWLKLIEKALYIFREVRR